jgi:hypothetical protein
VFISGCKHPLPRLLLLLLAASNQPRQYNQQPTRCFAFPCSIVLRKSRYDLGKSFFTNITPGYQLYPAVFLMNWVDPAKPGVL